MTIDMDRFRQVTGTQLPVQQEEASPYEGRTFAQLMMQDIPKWNSAMQLSIAKGDLAGARQYSDMIDGVANKYSDDWMQFTQSSGNHPVLARMREGAMKLLGGDYSTNVLNAALADKEIRDKAVTFNYGTGPLGSLASIINDPAADPEARSAANQKFMALGLPPDQVGSVKTRTVRDRVTGEDIQVREPSAPIDPMTRDSKEAHLNLLNSLEAQYAGDQEFMQSVGGISGLGAVSGRMIGTGGVDTATQYLRFAEETTADMKGANKANAFKSTVNLLSTISQQYNPDKDPIRAGYIVKGLEKAREALGADNFSMKAPAVDGALKLAFGANDIALQTAGVAADPEKFSVMVSAFAKRNARSGAKLSPDEENVLRSYDQGNQIKSGLTLGENPGMEPMVAMGADGKPVSTGLGGVGAEHSEMRNSLSAVLDSASSVAAATGQPFETVLKERMKSMFTDQILGRSGGKLQSITADYAADDPRIKSLMDKPPAGMKKTELGGGRIQITLPERRITREDAEGLAGLAAKVLIEKGTFNVNNVMGEIASIPEIAAEIGREVDTAIADSVASGKDTADSKQATSLARTTMKTPVGTAIVDDIINEVRGNEYELLKGTGRNTVEEKMLALVRKRNASGAAGLDEVWKPDTSDAYRDMLDGLESVSELEQLASGDLTKSKKADAFRESFIAQAKKLAGNDFFSTPDAQAKLQKVADQFLKVSAEGLLAQVNNGGFRDYDWKSTGGLRFLMKGKAFEITPYLERKPWEATVNIDGQNAKTALGAMTAVTALAPWAIGPAAVAMDVVMPGSVTADMSWPVKNQLDYIMLTDLVGADPKTKASGEQLYSDFMKNMLTRKPAQTATATTQTQAQQPAAPTDIDTYIDFGKSSTLGALTAAAALDAQNDKAVSYRHMEGTVKRLAKSVPDQYSVKVEEMAREQLSKTPKMSSKALYDYYEKNILGDGNTPGTLRHTILQQEVEKAKAIKAVKDEGESGFANPPPVVPK
jgi:hypothetical protein